MCEFVSFYVSAKGDIYIGNYASHGNIWVPQTGKRPYADLREAEWTGNGRADLKVRGDSGNWYKAQILGQYRTRSALLKNFPVGKIFGDFDQPRYVKLIQTKKSKSLGLWYVLEATDADLKSVKKIYALYRGVSSDYFTNAPVLSGPDDLSEIRIGDKTFRLTCGWYSYYPYENRLSVPYSKLPANVKLLLKDLELVWENRKLSYRGK